MNATISVLPIAMLLVIAGCKSQTQQAAPRPAPSVPVVNTAPAVVQPIAPTSLSAKDSDFLDSVNQQFIPSNTGRNQHITLDSDRLVYEEDFRLPGRQWSHVVNTVNLADLDVSKMGSPSEYSGDSDGPAVDIGLTCRNQIKCVHESFSDPSAYVPMISFVMGGIPYAHVVETGNGLRDMILRHSSPDSTASSEPVPSAPVPDSASPQREKLEAAAKVIITVWKEQLSKDEAEKLLAGLGFAPFKYAPPKDDALAYVKLDCVTGKSPKYDFRYYRGSLESMDIKMPTADRTAYNYVFDELKKSANLGDIEKELDNSHGVSDSWSRGQRTCTYGGGMCPQSSAILSYSPQAQDNDGGMSIYYTYYHTCPN